MSNTRTALPWDSIQPQVRKATLAYMKKEHGTIKRFANVRYITDYIYLMDDVEGRKYPHLHGEGWKTIATRITMSMRKMGWEEQAKGVFVIPEEVRR